MGASSALMAAALLWAASAIDWVAFEGGHGLRVLCLAGSVIGAAAVYFGCLLVSGVKLRQMLKR